MRINRFVAASSGLSRRAADLAISDGRVKINSRPARPGDQVDTEDKVTLDNNQLEIASPLLVALHKPAGYICSRRQQGNSPTIYDLLPSELQSLKSIGRLDKDSSGLLLLTNDGQLAQNLLHPSRGKTKRYLVETRPGISDQHLRQLEVGIRLDDGLSQMQTKRRNGAAELALKEGRNRQIRRTLAALGYEVIGLHRISFGDYLLNDLPQGQIRKLELPR